MGAFLGCCVVAGAIFMVGRRIARVLWGILCVIEKDDIQRRELEKQKAEIFGPRDHIANPTILDRVSNFGTRRSPPPWKV